MAWFLLSTGEFISGNGFNLETVFITMYITIIYNLSIYKSKSANQQIGQNYVKNIAGMDGPVIRGENNHLSVGSIHGTCCEENLINEMFDENFGSSLFNPVKGNYSLFLLTVRG